MLKLRINYSKCYSFYKAYKKYLLEYHYLIYYRKYDTKTKLDAYMMLQTCAARKCIVGQSDYRLVRHVEDSQEYRIVGSIMQVNPSGRVNRLPHRSTSALGQDVIDGQYANWSTRGTGEG